MKVKRWILALFGISLFLIVLSNVDIKKVAGTIFRMDYWLYALYLGLLCLMILIKAFKWKLIVNSMGSDIPLADAFRAVLSGLFLSNVTPGKIGDFSRAAYVAGGSAIPLGLASVFLDRLFDVIILLIFGAVAVLWLAQFTGIVVIDPLYLSLLLVAILAATFFFTKEKYVKSLLRPAFSIFIPDKSRSMISKGFSEFYSSIRSVRKNPGALALSVVVGFAMWAANCVMLFILASAINIDAPFYAIIATFPIMALSDLVPVSVSGLGTREAVMVFMFSIFSLPPESAVALSLLVFFNGYFLVSVAGFLSFISNPAKIDF